jgi:hypothetical protein
MSEPMSNIINIGCDPYVIRLRTLAQETFEFNCSCVFAAWYRTIKADGFAALGPVIVPYHAISSVMIVGPTGAKLEAKIGNTVGTA